MAISIRGKDMVMIIKHNKFNKPHSDTLPRIKMLLSILYKFPPYRMIENAVLNRNKNYIIAVNYHSIPSDSLQNFESQIKIFSNAYENINRSKLESFLRGDWPYAKPGIMLHFDDGLREHYEIAAPVLDKYAFTGWCHVITDNIDHNRTLHGKEPMSWQQAGNLAQRGHEICSHSCTHRRLSGKLSDEEIKNEVCRSYERIVSELGFEPVAFCYPGGEIDAYDIRAIRWIKSLYNYAFPSYTKKIRYNASPFAINRSNIESSWPLSAVYLSIGPLWQLKHRTKAHAYHKKLSME